MKKYIIVIVVVVLGLGASYIVLDKEAEKTVVQYSAIIENHKATTGKYPSTLDNIPMERKKVFEILEPLKIQYFNGKETVLFYKGFLFGPKKVFDLEKQEWRSEK